MGKIGTLPEGPKNRDTFPQEKAFHFSGGSVPAFSPGLSLQEASRISEITSQQRSSVAELRFPEGSQRYCIYHSHTDTELSNTPLLFKVLKKPA
jgi:hypothetical protein